MSKDTTPEVVDRKAELLARRAKREEDAEAKAQAYDLAVLELEDKLSAELGQRGQQFEIVEFSELGEPPVAVKCSVPGVRALYKAFAASKMNEADCDSYVVPCLVSPDATTYRDIVSRRPDLAYRVASAVSDLLGAKRAATAKK